MARTFSVGVSHWTLWMVLNRGPCFNGVSYRRERDRFFAQICQNGEQTYLGLFAKETDAARAYDHKAVELFGEFARANFPEEWPPDRRTQVRQQYLCRDE